MDVATGEGVSAALAGVESVIHAASDPRRPNAVDVNGTQRLVEAAHAANIGHFVYVSIVGIDRIPLGYYKCKLAAEGIVATSDLPYSILRATQFHTFVNMLLTNAARVPLVIPIPTTMRIQSVAPTDTAERLLRCLENGPGQRLPDFGGPEVMTLGEAAEQWRTARALRKRVMHLPVPGKVAAAFRAGENTVHEGAHGTIGWQEWLLKPKPIPEPSSRRTSRGECYRCSRSAPSVTQSCLGRPHNQLSEPCQATDNYCSPAIWPLSLPQSTLLRGHMKYTRLY